MRLVLLTVFFLFNAAAAEQIYHFDNPVDQKRFQQFTEELRCPQCQNQNIAGSDSLVAESVRQDLYEQILAGRSDKEITDAMVRRYGNYILYKPPFDWATAALWLSPVFLLLIGALVLWRIVRRRNLADSRELSADDEARIAEILARYQDRQEGK